MGECHCSKIAIMQLFHELKQQFPALPDHVVSQCIAQNRYNRESCARALHDTQDSRPPGGFPALGGTLADFRTNSTSRMNETSGRSRKAGPGLRAHRPVSLDIDSTPGSSILQESESQQSRVSSAPPACTTRRFFQDETPESQLNVNLDWNTESGAEKCMELGEGKQAEGKEGAAEGPCAHQPLLMIAPLEGSTRGFTSVNLTLRPPSSEPQPPIDITSQGSSLTYSSSSFDPRGFQSRLQISIGHGNQSHQTSATTRVKPPLKSPFKSPLKPPLVPQRPNTLVTFMHNPSAQSVVTTRPPGLPAGPPNQLLQLPRVMTAMSAPTTPSSPPQKLATPTDTTSTSLGAIPRLPDPGQPSAQSLPSEYFEILKQVEDEVKPLVMEQLLAKDRMAKMVESERIKLANLKKEVYFLKKCADKKITPQEYERQLRSEIYQLQLECDRLAEEVDRKSDSQVPLGETNEEFYQDIYTGQQCDPSSCTIPPILPSEPLAWEPEPGSSAHNQEESDGPSWVCLRCTFDNHPLLNKCEQCDLPRIVEAVQGETPDIRIRVTHHHNISPKRTIHNWVV